jgi:hypothetical protein
MRRPALVWAAALGGLAILDVWCDRNATKGDTLSECVRIWFRTDTPAGRTALVAFWLGLSGWVIPHWLRVVTDD